MLSAYLDGFLPIFHKIRLHSASAQELHQPGYAGNTTEVFLLSEQASTRGRECTCACHLSLQHPRSFLSMQIVSIPCKMHARCNAALSAWFSPDKNKNPNLRLDSTMPQYYDFLDKDPQMWKIQNLVTHNDLKTSSVTTREAAGYWVRGTDMAHERLSRLGLTSNKRRTARPSPVSRPLVTSLISR